MESKKFVLLDIDYITENDKAVIRLFGKLKGDEEGKSLIVLDKVLNLHLCNSPQ